MEKVLTPKEQEELAEKIEYSLRNYKGNRKDVYKQLANKYKTTVGFVMHVAKTRKTSLDKFVPACSEAEYTPEVESTSDIIIASTSSKLIDNAEEVKEVIEEENKEKARNQKRKEKVFITPEQENEIAMMYKEGIPESELAVAYDVSSSTIRRVIKRHGLELVHRPRKRLTDEQRKNLILDYISGKPRNVIANTYEVTECHISTIIKNYCSEEEIELARKNRSNASKQKSKRKYTKRTTVEKVEVKEKPVVEEKKPLEDTTTKELEKPVVKDTKPEGGATIEFANKTFTNDLLVRCRPTTYKIPTIDVGMIGCRHDLPVEESIFEGAIPNDKLFDFNWMEDHIKSWIDTNMEYDENGVSKKALRVYATGLTQVSTAIQKVVSEKGVNLIYAIYDDKENTYRDYNVVTEFGDMFKKYDEWKENYKYPFENSSSKIYLYDCTLADVTDKDDLYMISLNCHQPNVYDREKIIYNKCSNIILKDETHMWKLFSIFVGYIDKNRDKELNSVKMYKLSTTKNSFTIGDNIAKSFNFK